MAVSLQMSCLVCVGRKYRHLEWEGAVVYLVQVLNLAEVSTVPGKHGDLV